VVLRVQTNLSVSWFGTTVVHEVILKWPVCRETSSTPGLHSLSRRRETDLVTSSRIRPTASRSVRTPWLEQRRRSPDREASPPEVETSPPGGDRRDVGTRAAGRAALGAAQPLAAPRDGDHHAEPFENQVDACHPAQVHEARRGCGDAHGIGFLGSVGVPTPKRETTRAGRVDDRCERRADMPRRASQNGNRSSPLLTGVAGLV